MQHREPMPPHRLRHTVRIADQVGGGNPQRRTYQVGDPDLLEGHVERHGESLVHAVVFAHAQHFVFTAQEMADAAVSDRDAFRPAGRAGRVDYIRRIRGRGPPGGAGNRFDPACASRSSTAHTGTDSPSRLGSHARQVTSPAAPADCRHVSTRSRGVSASSGSHAAPLFEMPACAISKSAPRGRTSPRSGRPSLPVVPVRRPASRCARPIRHT